MFSTFLCPFLQYRRFDMMGQSSLRMEKKLVPTGATQFPGSFAPDLRKDSRIYVEKRTWQNILRSYITDGWEDISIWKSAVSVIEKVWVAQDLDSG